jgi:trans-aconitate methyltransferase
MTADVWAIGDHYESYVGRWSREVAVEFVHWLGVRPGGRWLDIGCGTGALTESVLRVGQPAEVVGIDPSEGFIEHARATLTDARATFEVADAQALPRHLREFDAVVSGLVLNFIPDKEEALKQMTAAVRPRGVVAAYVWDYAERMEIIRYFWEAASDIDPAARELDEGLRFPICRPGPLLELFARQLRGAEVREIVIPTTLASFDEYWRPFLGGQGPAPGYATSLSEENRERLRAALSGRLPTAPDGSIRLEARAWAVRGSKAV